MKLKAKHLKVIKWVGYPLFALICLFFSLVWTFPVAQLKGKITGYIEKQFKMKVEMEQLSTVLPFGLKAKNLIITPASDEPNDAFPLTVPYLKVNAGVLSYLLNSPSGSFTAEIFGGEVEGKIKISKKARTYQGNFKIDSVKFQEMPLFKNKYKDLPMKGVLSLKGDFDLNLEKIDQSNGLFEMRMDNGSIGPGKFGIELPEIKTGTVTSKLVLKAGKMDVEQFKQESPDISADMQGSISLAPDLMQSRANLDYRFKMSDELLNKNDIFKVALSAMKNAEGTDKYFYHTLKGTLKDLKPVANKGLQSKFKDSGNKPAAPKPPKEAKPPTPKPPPPPAPAIPEPSKEASKSAPPPPEPPKEQEKKPEPIPEIIPPPPPPAPPIAPPAPEPPKAPPVEEKKDEPVKELDENAAKPTGDDQAPPVSEPVHEPGTDEKKEPN